MKILATIGIWIFTIASGIAQERVLEIDAVPTFVKLSDWLAFVKRDNFHLLESRDQNGYFFAIFRDAQGDVAICHYWKNPKQERPSRASYDVTDLEGRSLIDSSSKRSFSVTSKLVIKEPQSVIFWSDGVICPMIADVPDRVKVNYSSGGDEGALKIVFDEIVTLNRGQPKATEQPGARPLR